MGKKAKVNDSKYQSLKMSVTDKGSWRSQQIIKGRCVTDKRAFLNTSGAKITSKSGIHVNGEDTNNDETRRKQLLHICLQDQMWRRDLYHMCSTIDVAENCQLY